MIRAFSREKFEEKRFEGASRGIHDHAQKQHDNHLYLLDVIGTPGNQGSSVRIAICCGPGRKCLL